MINRTRRGAEQAGDRPTGPVPVSSSPTVYQDANGHLVNAKGNPMPKEDLYDLQVTNVSIYQGSYEGVPKDSLKITLDLLGTEQPFGEYAGKPYITTLFVPIPGSGKLLPTVAGQPKKTQIHKMFTTMGYDVNPRTRMQDIIIEGTIGAYMRGHVFHNDKGYACVKVNREVEDEDGNKINRGLVPVKNEEFLKENIALRNGIFRV